MIFFLLAGSPLQPFGCLTVVYALLAKVPAPNLVVVTICEEPLLMALFPTICQLFNRLLLRNAYYELTTEGAQIVLITEIS